MGTPSSEHLSIRVKTACHALSDIQKLPTTDKSAVQLREPVSVFHGALLSRGIHCSVLPQPPITAMVLGRINVHSAASRISNRTQAELGGEMRSADGVYHLAHRSD